MSPTTAASAAIRDLALAATRTVSELVRRIYIPLTPTSPPGLVQANTVDPWQDSGKYALGWTYFCLALMGLVLLVRVWHFWQDKIRQAIYKQEVEEHYANLYSLEPGFEQTAMATGQTSQRNFFPDDAMEEKQFKPKAHFSSVGPVLDTLALFRWIFYRPVPDLVWRKHRFTFSSAATLTIVFTALSFVTLYCFLQQPLYWQSIQFGSPPLAVRSGMIAVAMTPWIIATSMKANLLTVVTGIGPERLNVLHRWLGYLCLFLSLVHTIPFYVQPVWDDGGSQVFQRLFDGGSGVIYGTGIACLVPLVWLCVASLPLIRRIAYEVFVMLHVPVGIIYLGLLFWHTKNYLASWDYLWATVAVWVFCYILRVFNLNWFRPWQLSFMVGDEAAITLMSENAIKITIPTQMRWKPGQYVYLRMPGISLFENHPFTISSLCSEDFPSEYGEEYRDLIMVFRPYGGFTRKVLETAIEKGPFHTYRAFLDGPYGGMRRDLAAFDTCILIAGGSGITALVSQLLNLIKRMRDGKAITKKVVVVWALKRLEALDWFREELRICRESAPPESVTCKFFVTAAVRQRRFPGQGVGGMERAPRPLSHLFHDKLDGFVAGIASKRNSQLIRDEAAGDVDRERELREEDEDRITALPQQKYLQHHVMPPHNPQQQAMNFPPPPPGPPPGIAVSRYSPQEESLRRLEGLDGASSTAADDNSPDSRHQQHQQQQYHNNQHEPQDHHDADHPPRAFHFPPIVKPDDATPHFNYAPPSPRRFDFSQQQQQQQPQYHATVEEEDPNNDPSKAGPSTTAYGAATPHFTPAPGLLHQPQYQPPQQQQHHHSASLEVPRPPELAHLRTALGTGPGVSAGVASNRNSFVASAAHRPVSTFGPPAGFDFGFPETPTEFQKSLMRFAFPIPHQIDGGWSVEYGRPDLGYMLKEWATGGADGRGILGRRTAVYVCGPPSMRIGVANTVARLQAEIWGDDLLEEIFLHTENYAL